MATHSSILAWDPMDRGVWRATVHGVTKSQTQLSNFTLLLVLPSMGVKLSHANIPVLSLSKGQLSLPRGRMLRIIHALGGEPRHV